MNKLSAIKPGDEIVYQAIIQTGSGKKSKKKFYKGKVIQITDRLIVVKGEQYPEAILINDLVTGQAKILKVRGEKFDLKQIEMINTQPQAEIEQAFLDDGLNSIFQRRGK